MAPNLMNVESNPNISNWTVEHGYSNKTQQRSYPFSVFNAWLTSALGAMLGLDKDNFHYITINRIPGFRFFFHTHFELSIMSRKMCAKCLCLQRKNQIVRKYHAHISRTQSFEFDRSKALQATNRKRIQRTADCLLLLFLFDVIFF